MPEGVHILWYNLKLLFRWGYSFFVVVAVTPPPPHPPLPGNRHGFDGAATTGEILPHPEVAETVFPNTQPSVYNQAGAVQLPIPLSGNERRKCNGTAALLARDEGGEA